MVVICYATIELTSDLSNVPLHIAHYIRHCQYRDIGP